MNRLFPATVAALVLLTACNKPESEAAVPANETTDTVAAAGAPMADSIADSAASDSTTLDTMKTDTTNN